MRGTLAARADRPTYRDQQRNCTGCVMSGQPAKIIDPGVRIGHVHLKVADLERSLGFYRDVLGFKVTRHRRGAVFMAAGDYHHHLAINTWESLGGQPPAPGTTGLYHTAILYPTRWLLADALRRVIEAKIPLDGASDHGVSEALYLRDPDENGVELYRDRPREQWKYDADGDVVMQTEPLDLRDLLAELEKAPA
jgi:catechol 2,3-dioxygenase